jgi:hypothetical protein
MGCIPSHSLEEALEDFLQNESDLLEFWQKVFYFVVFLFLLTKEPFFFFSTFDFDVFFCQVNKEKKLLKSRRNSSYAPS